jgi:FMN phosphatase YigB (HAD superfamily)
MSTITSVKVLSFDAYGTLIDFETGIINALNITLPDLPMPINRTQLIDIYSKYEKVERKTNPRTKWADLLTAILPSIASDLNLPAPTKEQAQALGNSIEAWPAFPDTVSAFHRLTKHYKLVILKKRRQNSNHHQHHSLSPELSFRLDPHNR